MKLKIEIESVSRTKKKPVAFIVSAGGHLLLFFLPILKLTSMRIEQLDQHTPSQLMSLHREYICEGQCTFDLSYIDEYLRILSEYTYQYYGESAEIVRCTHFSRLRDLEMFDPSLSPDLINAEIRSEFFHNFHIDRHLVVKTSIAMSIAFSYNLTLQLDNQLTGEFSPRHHLFLWCTVKSRNNAILRRYLENRTGQTPVCILQSLLLFAIYQRDLKCIEVLLECGAKVEHRLSMKLVTSPLRSCLSHFNNNSSRRISQMFGIKIMEILLRYLSPETIDNSDKHLLLRQDKFSRIFDLNQNVAGLVLDLTKCYQQIPDRYAPLDELFFLNDLYRGTVEPYRSGYRSFVLPLIRSGCSMSQTAVNEMRRDITGFFMRHHCFCKCHPTLRHLLPNWPNYMADIVNASISYDKLRINKFHLNSKDDIYCVKMINNSYLCLQSMARAVVLKQLPRGFSKRESLINSFNLPNPLKFYLKFGDIEDKIIQLERTIDIGS